jgi:hypothetical protein
MLWLAWAYSRQYRNTGEHTFCIIAEWTDMDAHVNARDRMIARLDSSAAPLKTLVVARRLRPGGEGAEIGGRERHRYQSSADSALRLRFCRTSTMADSSSWCPRVVASADELPFRYRSSSEPRAVHRGKAAARGLGLVGNSARKRRRAASRDHLSRRSQKK